MREQCGKLTRLPAKQDLAEPVRGLFLHSRKDVPVHVERHGGRGMAEALRRSAAVLPSAALLASSLGERLPRLALVVE